MSINNSIAITCIYLESVKDSSLMHLNILSTFAGRFIFASFSYPCRRYSYIAIEYPVGDIQVNAIGRFPG